jgi:aminoglycoside phosphotransferase (APT) family kinase protein
VLDAPGVVSLLVKRGLLDSSEILEGELRLVDASRRNRNFHVLRKRRPSYLVKQGLGRERRQTVEHEAAIYDYLRAIDGEEMGTISPHVSAYLPAQAVLVVESVEGAESLESLHVRRPRFPIAHARRLAHALHTLHRATATEQARQLYEERFPALPIFVPLSGRPHARHIEALSNGVAQAIRMIQNTAHFAELLDAASRSWTPTCLVHGDLRFDNCLITTRGEAIRKGRVTLVDWELATWGDPCWDAGAVLGAYLASWLLACPVSGEAPLEPVMALGRHRLPDVQRAAGAFWTAYAAGMAGSLDAANVSLDRAMRFAAVHLLQTMVEDLQESTELTSHAVCLAQLAFNLLARPAEAADHFLSLPVTA